MLVLWKSIKIMIVLLHDSFPPPQCYLSMAVITFMIYYYNIAAKYFAFFELTSGIAKVVDGIALFGMVKK